MPPVEYEDNSGGRFENYISVDTSKLKDKKDFGSHFKVSDIKMSGSIFFSRF